MATFLSQCGVLLRVLVVVQLAALWGCVTTDSGSEPAEHSDVPVGLDAHPPGPLHPDTLSVDDEHCIDAVEVSEDLRSITLSLACDPEDFGLEPGRILLGSTDGGYLRRVDSLEVSGPHRVIARTSFVTLAESFTDIEVGGHWDFGSREVIDFSGQTLQGEDGAATFITVPNGSIEINPELDIDVELGFLSLRKAIAVLALNLDVDLEGLFVYEAGEESGGFIELETIHHPLDVKAGPKRLRGELRMVVRLGYRNLGDGPGRVNTVMRGSGRIEMGGTWTKPDEWENHWDPVFNGELLPMELTGAGDWQGELLVQVEAYLSLQKVEGSSFRFEAWSGGDAVGDCAEKTWNADGGLRGEATMRLGFFDDGPRDERMPDLREDIEPISGTLSDAAQLCPDQPPVEAEPEEGGADSAAVGGDEDVVSGACAQFAEISCGDIVTGDTSDASGYLLIDGYEQVVGNYEAPEEILRWTAPSSGPVEFGLLGADPMSVNHDVFVLDEGNGLCLAGDFVSWGFHTAAFDAVAGRTYMLIVDGYAADAGAFTVQLDCSP